MRTLFLAALNICLLVSLVGCGSGGGQKAKKKKGGGPVAVKKQLPPLPTPAELYKKSREELAKHCDELLEELREKERLRGEGHGAFVLSPDVRLPLAVPIYHEAKFAKGAGISLPPYLPEGTTDSVLAVHVARHGDIEAAQKLVDPADRAALAGIESLKTARNYPVEWSRLIGLMLHSAEFSMLTGNSDSAKDLLVLRQQLTEMSNDGLPPALETALLSRGKSSLKLAADAWRKGPHAALSREIEAYLAKWPNRPLPVILPPRSARSEVSRTFAVESPGKALMAVHPLRGLDLLCLPLPSQDVEAVTALLDAFDRLQEIMITYAASPPDVTRAQQLGQHFDNSATAEVDNKTAAHCWYRFADVKCDIQLITRNPSVAALVRLTASEPLPNDIVLPRDFGAIHLSRTFERNRAGTALHERAPRLVLARANVLEKIVNPLPVLPLDHVALARSAADDTIEEVTFQYRRPDKAPNTLARIALPLLDRMGAPQLWLNGKDVLLYWEDAETRIVLTVPDHPSSPVKVTAADAAGSKDRLTRALAWDRAERVGRIEANEPQLRLPRELSGVELGMTRAQVHEITDKMPDGKHTDLAGVDRFVWTGQPIQTGEPIVREMFVYYDASGKASMIRARYDFGRGSPDIMLDPIRARAGAAQPLPLTAAAVWSDLPPQPSPSSQQWEDDMTVLNVRRGEFMADVAIRDFPITAAKLEPLPKLTYLTPGVLSSKLGNTRQEMAAAWGVREQIVGGATLYSPPEGSPYDAVLVWFQPDKIVKKEKQEKLPNKQPKQDKQDKLDRKDERAVKIVARHRIPAKKLGEPAQAGLVVRQEWAKKTGEYGWPWRQDVAPGNVTLGWGHHDDATRVRIFWQDGAQGRQIFTEWMPVK